MRWYDYLMCVLVAALIWASIMVGDVLGLVINVWIYKMYEDMRVGEQ